MKLMHEAGSNVTIVQLVDEVEGNASSARITFKYTAAGLHAMQGEMDKFMSSWGECSLEKKLSRLDKFINQVIKTKLYMYVNKKHDDKNTLFNSTVSLFGYGTYDDKLTFEKIQAVHNFINRTLKDEYIVGNAWRLYQALVNFKCSMMPKDGALSNNVYNGDLQSALDYLINSLASVFVSLTLTLSDTTLTSSKAVSEGVHIWNIVNSDQEASDIHWCNLDGCYESFNNIMLCLNDINKNEEELSSCYYSKLKSSEEFDQIKSMHVKLIEVIVSLCLSKKRLSSVDYLKLKLLLDFEKGLGASLDESLLISASGQSNPKKRRSPRSLMKHLINDVERLLQRSTECITTLDSIMPGDGFALPELTQAMGFCLSNDEKLSDEGVHIGLMNQAVV
jgi:hypothetical protein